MKGLVVYAPAMPDAGDLAIQIAKYKLLSHIVIDADGSRWKPGDPVPDDTLIMTNCANVEGALDFSEVLGRMHFQAMAKEKRIAYEDRNALLFPHLRYSSKEIGRYLLWPVWLRYIRKAFVFSLGWIPSEIRGYLGIR